MFNSPINRLFGITGVGKDNKRQDKKKQEQEKNQKKTFFDDEDSLCTDISIESFDIENFIRRYLENVKSREISIKSKEKIEEFLLKFDIKIFAKRYGTNLSKEDVTVILYDLLNKWGIVLEEY